MKFVLGQEFANDATFTKQQLLDLTPTDIKRWLNFRAYGKPNPDESDRPTKQRSGSLQKAKGGVSYYHPNKHIAWVEGREEDARGFGNPTQHPIVSAVIAKVRKHEVRGQGAPTRVKREFTQDEFYKMLEILRGLTPFESKAKFPLMAIWAYHLVHRLDDTSNFRISDPKGNRNWPFLIQTKTKWSKNVRSERECPDQIIIGAQDARICPQLWLAIYLEEWLEQNPDAIFMFTNNNEKDDDGNYKGPKQVKSRFYNCVRKKVYEDEEFKALVDHLGNIEELLGLGTHSVRKYACSHGKRKGATGAQVDGRGRWIGEKSGRISQTVYVSPIDEWEDAHVAALLCDGGPIRYSQKAGLVITNEFLFQHVIPNIRRRFPTDDRFCRVLGLAYLHAVYEPSLCEFIDNTIATQVKAAFVEFFTAEAVVEDNPVVKIPLEIYRVEDRLVIQDRFQPTGAATANPDMNNTNGDSQQQALPPPQQQFTQIMTYLRTMDLRLQTQMQNLQRQQEQYQARNDTQFRRVMDSQRRYGGSLHSAFARQHPGFQQRNRNHQNMRLQQNVARRFHNNNNQNGSTSNSNQSNSSNTNNNTAPAPPPQVFQT